LECCCAGEEGGLEMGKEVDEWMKKKRRQKLSTVYFLLPRDVRESFFERLLSKFLENNKYQGWLALGT
jgi:hypothetical protein